MMHTVVISNLPYSVIFSFLIKCWSQPFIAISLLTSRLQPTLCKSAVMSMIRVLWQHTHKRKTLPRSEKALKEAGLRALINMKVAEPEQRSYDALINLFLQ